MGRSPDFFNGVLRAGTNAKLASIDRSRMTDPSPQSEGTAGATETHASEAKMVEKGMALTVSKGDRSGCSHSPSSYHQLLTLLCIDYATSRFSHSSSGSPVLIRVSHFPRLLRPCGRSSPTHSTSLLWSPESPCATGTTF